MVVPMSAAVRLTWPEARQAAETGVHRRLVSLARRRGGSHGKPGAGISWDLEIESAAAELALAKLLDRFWSMSDELDVDGDVGREQVRHTVRPDGRLIVHPGDLDGARYWLVTGKMPDFRVVGWLLGRDAKDPRYWTDPGTGRPAYFVPQADLVPIDAEQPVDVELELEQLFSTKGER
jgi:hypothetical protein